jgi:hypothetical protein
MPIGSHLVAVSATRLGSFELRSAYGNQRGLAADCARCITVRRARLSTDGGRPFPVTEWSRCGTTTSSYATTARSRFAGDTAAVAGVVRRHAGA